MKRGHQIGMPIKVGKQINHRWSSSKQEECSSLFLWQLQPRNLARIQKHEGKLVGGAENKYPEPQEPPALAPPQPVPSGASSTQNDTHICMVLVLYLKEGRNATNGRIRRALPSAFLLCCFKMFNHPVSHSIALPHSPHTPSTTSKSVGALQGELNIWRLVTCVPAMPP